MEKQATLETYRAIGGLLRCPLCGKRGRIAAFGGFLCEKKHCFDLAARGYLNLIPAQNQEKQKYDRGLFQHRGQVFRGGFYDPVAAALGQPLNPDALKSPAPVVLDVGCGEGFFLGALAKHLPADARLIGMDLSRDAIRLAAVRETRACWLIANLKAIPLAKGSVDRLLNILTPADYREFSRVLTPDGLLIKVIPGPEYLREIRALLPGKGSHDPEQTADYFEKHMRLVERRRVRTVYADLTPEQAEAFLGMTPLTFDTAIQTGAGAELKRVTVDLEILVGRRKR